MRIKRDPVPYIVAEPLPSNILEWHYVVTGENHTFPVGEMQNRVAEFCYCFCLYKGTHSFDSPLVAQKLTRFGQVLE